MVIVLMGFRLFANGKLNLYNFPNIITRKAAISYAD